MLYRRSARRFAPSVRSLEQRCLLSLAAEWRGQDGSDYVGLDTQATWGASRNPNNYVDIRIHLTDLKGNASAVSHVKLGRLGGNESWDYKVISGSTYQGNMVFIGTGYSGDLFLEPQQADAAGTTYENLTVEYNNGTPSDFLPFLSNSSNANYTPAVAVNPNKLMASGISLIPLSQDDVDLTGPGPSVGPDGILDFGIQINLPTNASIHTATLTGPGSNPTRWQGGIEMFDHFFGYANPEGYWNAELVPYSTSVYKFYGSPTASLSQATVNMELIYADPNRAGKKDTAFVTMPTLSTTANKAYPSVASPTQTAATWGTQITTNGLDRGFVPISLAAIPGHSYNDVKSAMLTDEVGNVWVYKSAPNRPDFPFDLKFSDSTGIFSFPPARDESDSTLTLQTFDASGNQLSLSRFSGGSCDADMRDDRVPSGTTGQNATPDTPGQPNNLAYLVSANYQNIFLPDGTYTFFQPLVLNNSITITGGPNAVIRFVPSSTQAGWSSSPGAIMLNKSGTTLSGFQIDLVTAPDLDHWLTGGAADHTVIFINEHTRGTTLTNLTILAEPQDVRKALDDPVNYAHQPINVIHGVAPDASGRISGNVIRGGPIKIKGGPWQVLNNDFQGPYAGMESVAAIGFAEGHDLLVEGNHVHLVDQTGVTAIDRLITTGGGGLHRTFHVTIQDNVFDGGAGQTTTPVLGGNHAEVIVLEGYGIVFEGVPGAISPDGMILEISKPQGSAAAASDVVAILTGPASGQWLTIAQRLPDAVQGGISYQRYLLNSPLPLVAAGQRPNYVVSITHGNVATAIQRNTIDLSTSRVQGAGDVGLKNGGHDFGMRVLNNTFIGSNGIELTAYSSNKEDTGDIAGMDGWTRLPAFDVRIDGNTFRDNDVAFNLFVGHGTKGSGNYGHKSNAGRLYWQGSFTNNRIQWTGSVAPKADVGLPDFSHADHSWIDDGEMRLSLWGNSASGALQPQVHAATIQGKPGGSFDVQDNLSLPALPTAMGTIAIDSGGGAVGDFAADNSMTGGTARPNATSHAIDVGGVTDPAPQSVYQSERYGSSFSYAISVPTPGASYLVRLHFAETFSSVSGAGQRLINVAINSRKVLSNFDVYAAAGNALYKAVVREFVVQADTNGIIAIAFSGSGYGPKVSGIEVKPVARVATDLAVRAGTSGSGDYTSDAAVVIGGTVGSPVGQSIATTGIINPAPQAVYQTERYGSAFSYTFPNLTPGSFYKVRLHFAETFSSVNGEGQRPINITINGQRVKTDFDIYKEAGDQRDRAVVLEHTVKADPAGRIVIGFLSGASGYGAKVNGIQVYSYNPDAVAINAGPDSSFAYDKDATAGYLTVSGGSIGTPIAQAIDVSGVADPAPQSVYQSERYGAFTYTIQPPFHPGASYLVRLHFAETYSGVTAEGQRLINVSINGRQVLTNFDVYAAAGDTLYKAVVEQFNVTADSVGKIVIAFTGSGYGPKLSGLQILPNAVTKFDLSGYFNEVGISSDAHPPAGGLDGSGNSVSSDATGTTITWNSFDFHIGSPDQTDGLGNAVKNSIKANGQSIVLPGCNSSSIRLIGTATNGAQTGTFTVHYDDGSTATFVQTFSDWFVGPLPLGETIAKRLEYRNTASGQQTGPFYLYGYTFILDPAKAVSSIDLPNNANMHIFALDLVQ